MIKPEKQAVLLYNLIMNTFTMMTRPDEDSAKLSELILQTLAKQGYVRDDLHPDTVFTVGGDGTFLYAVDRYMDQLDRVRFYGIHTGTLGFYTDYRGDEAEAFLSAFINGEVKETKYPVLEVSTDNGILSYAINEARIENASRTQKMDVSLNGSFFEQYHGTGLCLSTQLGSTAYNRSLNGAVVQEGLDVLQLCEIAGIHHAKYHSLGSPLLLKPDTVVTLRSDSYEGALLGMDSRVISLDESTEVTISVSRKKQVRMLKGREVSYFNRLKNLF